LCCEIESSQVEEMDHVLSNLPHLMNKLCFDSMTAGDDISLQNRSYIGT
jgi:hypothetical protein